MASDGDSAASAPKLTATYNSPTSQSFVVSEQLPSLPTSPDAVEQKTKYLQSLRTAISAAQEQINRELTQRMEEDKARDAASKSGQEKEREEEKEEENYGEEEQAEEE